MSYSNYYSGNKEIKIIIVIPAKAGIQRRMSMRRMSHTARRRGPLDPRFHGDDKNGVFVT